MAPRDCGSDSLRGDAAMKIALIQLDGKMPNLALMKLSAWHKQQGDEVTVFDLSTNQFDRVYASKVFVGGSGYDLASELPDEIELCTPDYETFKTDYSIGFTSRGCIRDCGFCIVREKEGAIRDLPFDWISHHKVIVLDNNFLASPTWREKLEYFIRQNLKVNFNQGLDIRLITDENAALLAQVKYYNRGFYRRCLYFAFDDPALEPAVRQGIEILLKHGVKPRHLMIYILVAYNTTFTEDYHRFQVINDYGCLPYIQIYNNRRDRPIARRFARWINQRYYHVVPWEEFQ